jgi:hypothetical protein
MTPYFVTAGVAAGLLAMWYAARRHSHVPCTIDLENTNARFHAHVALQGVEVNEGDEVLVHGAPTRIAHGEVKTVEATATVAHASALRRWWTRTIGTSEITSLYEVGFEG